MSYPLELWKSGTDETRSWNYFSSAGAGIDSMHSGGRRRDCCCWRGTTLPRLPGARYFSVKSRSQQETGCNSDGSKEEALIKGLSEIRTGLRESAGLLQVPW